MHRAAGLVRRDQDLFAGRRQLMLAQRFADIDPPRGKERIGHAATDNQVIDLGDEMSQHVEL